MWPSRHGLGVQLSYGLHGANIYSEELDPEHPWQFARDRDGGSDLTKIHNSTQRLVPPQISNVDISASKDDKLNDVLTDIPVNLMRQLKYSEEYMTSEFVYDPTSGNMIDDGVFKRFHIGTICNVIAYASGSASSTLNVHVLSTRKDIVQDENEQKFEIEVPVLERGGSWDFGSPLKQIEIWKASPVGSREHNSIVVRTAASINVMRIEVSAKLAVTIKLLREFEPEEFHGNSFSWVAVSPFHEYEFTVVDEAGNWAVCRINPAGKHISFFGFGKIFDAEDFSHFKRISWGADESTILVMSRSYIKLFDRDSGVKTDIVSAKKWSLIRDYKRWWSDDRFGFLLTSRELIWVDVSDGFKRLLVWKHYLDADDPSLSFQVKTVDTVTFVSLHSQVHPLVFIFQFKVEDGLPKSLRDPLMIKTDTSTSASSYLLAPIATVNADNQRRDEHISLALFKMSTQLEMTRMVISTLKNASLLKYSSHKRNSILSKKEDKVLDRRAATFNHQVKGVIRDLANDIFQHPPNDEANEAEDSEIFQEYALSLGFHDNKEKQPSTLFRRSKPFDKFNDFEEFDNMMEQLQEFCESKKVTFWPLGKTSVHICDEKYSTIKGLYSHLFKLWSKDTSSTDINRFFTKHITKELALSLSITFDEALEERKLSKKVSRLPKNLKSIVDKWEEGFEEAEKEEIPKQLLETAPSEPIITVSQSHPTSVTSASQGLLKPSQRMTSQSIKPSQSINPSQSASQSIRSSQQLPSQSQPKKKKRRIKGFG